MKERRKILYIGYKIIVCLCFVFFTRSDIIYNLYSPNDGTLPSGAINYPFSGAVITLQDTAQLYSSSKYSLRIDFNGSYAGFSTVYSPIINTTAFNYMQIYYYNPTRACINLWLENINYVSESPYINLSNYSVSLTNNWQRTIIPLSAFFATTIFNFGTLEMQNFQTSASTIWISTFVLSGTNTPAAPVPTQSPSPTPNSPAPAISISPTPATSISPAPAISISPTPVTSISPTPHKISPTPSNKNSTDSGSAGETIGILAGVLGGVGLIVLLLLLIGFLLLFFRWRKKKQTLYANKKNEMRNFEDQPSIPITYGAKVQPSLEVGITTEFYVPE